MADLRYRVVVDDAEARRRLRELLSNTGVSSQAGSGGGADDAKKAAAGIEDVRRAQISLKDAQEAAVNSLKNLRQERAKELSELTTLKQIESEAATVLAEKKAKTEALTQAQQKANIELQKSRKDAVEYNLALKQQAEERRKATEEERKAEKVLRDAQKVLKDAERQQAQLEKAAARRRKQLQQESSEYYQLNQALGKVRKETKDLLAEMFRLERQGKKNSAAYEFLRQKAEALTKQTQYLDSGIKKIDATLGLHQRHVGDYGRAMEEMSPIIMDINRKLGLFGTSIDQLAGKPAAIKELGAAFVTMGRGIVSFLLSPIGLLIIAVTALFKLFTGNKQTVIDFNNGLLNVSKTTGLAGAELQSLSDAIIKLSRSLKTVSTDKLLEYATVAGQLGVKGSANILAFTEALAKLETASDISGEEGGAQIARLLTLVDGGVQNVKAFGDEIVNLGNNFPATEAEILANATRIAQATGVYKIGRQEVLAYATATKSVGVEAELVGSTMGRTLGILEKVIRTGKGVETVLKLVGGTQAELGARFRADAAGVLTDFIGGLNKVKGGASGVNQALSAIGISAIRDRTVLGALATNGYDVLTNSLEKVRDATGAMDDEFGTASQKLVNQSARVGIAWDNLVLSIENGQGVIGKSSIAIVGFFADIIEAITPAGSATQALTEEYIKQRNEVAATEGKIKPLLERYDELKHSGHLNTKQQKELKDIIQQIAAVMPSAVSGWNSLGEALDINRSKVLGLTEAHRELLREMNLSTTRELNQQFEQQAKMADRAYKILNNNKFDELGLERHRERFATVKNELLNTAEELRSIGNTLTSEQRDVLDRYGFFNAGIVDAELPARFKKVDNTVVGDVDEAARKKAEDAAKRAEEQRRQAFERQRALQLSIDAINEQASRNNLTRDQQEIASIKDKYAKIEEEVRKFYDNPKNKDFKVDMSGLQRSKDFEVSEAETRQNSTTLAKSLDAQKALVDEYNAYAESTSIEAAEKRFAKELELIKSYRQRIEQERAKIGAAQMTASAFGMFGAPAALTLAQQEADKALKERGEAFDKEEVRRQDQKFIKLINAYQTFEQKRKTVLRESNEEITKLESAGENERAEVARKERDKALAEIGKSNLMSLEEFKKLTEDFEDLSVKAGRNAAKQAKKMFENYIHGSKLTQGEINNLRSFFTKFFVEIDEALDNRIVANFDALAASIGRISSSLGSIDDALGKNLQNVTNLVSGLSDVRAGLVGMKQASKNGDIMSGLASFGGAFGGLVAAVGGIFSNVLSKQEDKWQEKQAMEQKQMEARNRALEHQLNLLNDIYGTDRLDKYRSILKELDDQERGIRDSLEGRVQYTGDRKTDGYIDQYNAGKITEKSLEEAEKHARWMFENSKNSGTGPNYTWLNQAEEYKKALKAIRESAKLTGDESIEWLLENANLDDDTIKKLIELKDKTEEYKNILKQLKAELTGTSISALADEIASMFENGTIAAEDFGNNFEKIMQKALVNSFKQKLMQEQLEPWFDSFYNMLEGSDGLPTKEQIDKKRQEYLKIGEDSQKRWEAIEKATGIDMTGQSSSSLKSESVARQLTEATGGEIVGMYRAGYDIAKQQLNILHSQQATQVNLLAVAQNKLIALNAIQVNTYNTASEALNIANNTANMLNELKAVNRNLGGKYVN